MKFKRYHIGEIPNQRDSVEQEIEFPKDECRVTGFLLISDQPAMCFNRGEIKISINGKEVLPKGYAAQLLMSGANVAPDQRYHSVDFETGDLKCSILYKDTDNPIAPFVAGYNVWLYVRFE